MVRKEYSAGMIKFSFWFTEFRKMVYLINQGKSLNEIKILNAEQNIFAAPTQRRAVQIYNTVSSRVGELDPSFYQLFEKSDVSTQKLIVLIAIMQSDSLFFDFVYEVYREKLIVGDEELTDSDIRIFFNNKQLQSEKVAKWTDNTVKKLGRCYKAMIMDAGLTDYVAGNRKVLRPILDHALEECLKNNGMELIIHALTGVR
ncbi:DUF1819 family protein [Paenibacillus alvei]|uniref:DUF1819 family protein n=1 Tax=Paenibacillus alvei TaxID=44250 RepID=UPI0013DBDF74|nr:DUF1819 family protein [Paenibacillus alvei]NEZ41030.1 DUF1819 family protein [Paenibacillus alvei]